MLQTGLPRLSPQPSSSNSSAWSSSRLCVDQCMPFGFTQRLFLRVGALLR
jgi:hypothetical protein